MFSLITDISLYFFCFWYTFIVLHPSLFFLCLNEVFFLYVSNCSHWKHNMSHLMKSFICRSNYYTYQLLVSDCECEQQTILMSLCSSPVYPKEITKHHPSRVLTISDLKMRPVGNLMNLRSIYREPGRGRTSNFIFN